MPAIKNRRAAHAARTALFVALDAALINAAMLIALWIMNDMALPRTSQWLRYGNLWPVMTAITLACFALTRLYSTLWHYASIDEVVRIGIGTLSGMGLTFAFSQTMAYVADFNYFLLEKASYLIAWFLLTFFVLTARFSFRIFTRYAAVGRIQKDRRKRVMILGAGWSASNAIRDLNASGGRNGMAVVALDDDPAKAGTRIGAVPVRHGIDRLEEYVGAYAIQEILIAMPSAPRERMRGIVERCMRTGCALKIVPAIRDVSKSGEAFERAREVDIADLLFRQEVELSEDSVGESIRGKTILVTGGGGSIGSELCKQLARFGPKSLLILDIYENHAYELMNEFRANYGKALDVRVLIGSVRDEARLDRIFREHRPDAVFHAAAHKHVSLMEANPSEAIKNNVFGTLNVARCADKWGVDRMVLISSDKAVNPTNVYGATKRVIELIMRSELCRNSKTRFMAVRFGNVLGSRGSVIPIFQRQLAAGGPLRVTDPEMTRYYMTIPEAARLVLQAAAYGEDGAEYILEMGTPVKTIDLARNLIRLSGYEPDIDIKIEVVGLLPGEKRREELVMADELERVEKTASSKITVVRPAPFDERALQEGLSRLRDCADGEPEQIEEALRALVPTFQRNP